MEEVGAQVATPIFIRQALQSRFCEGPPMAKKKKKGVDPCHDFQNPGGTWDPRVWDWDSAGFSAKPLEQDVLRLGTSSEKEKGDGGVDCEKLHLKLGGGLSPKELPVSRPSKRVRSGSPGGPHAFPMCQVDHCREDLSIAKDYHRRHKVCEVHSKSANALVGNQMQRFCQQCSRFHPLPEFDEGKRSCRRRLAGHNRRRRKTQHDDITSRLSLPGNHDNSASENLDIVGLLAALARAQGSANSSLTPDKERLVQILGKIKSLPLPADFMAKLPISGSFGQKQASLELHDRLNGTTSSSSTMDLLPVLSATLAASSTDALAAVSQSSQSSESKKTELHCLDHGTGLNSQERSTLEFPSVQKERSNAGFQHFVNDSDCRAQGIRPNLPLQLFSSSPEYSSPPKLATDKKYFSSGGSNPMDERSPSSSPVAQTFFPMQTLKETIKHEKISISRGANVNVGASQIPLQLFRQPNRDVDGHSYQSFPHQAGNTSSSGSDHSPSSLNSDAQDRTGRIVFKLFDKDPSHIPGPLRAQIYNWLSHSPSEMESYIRPGCVVLSIYVSMPPAAWEQLEGNLLDRVNRLVQDPDSDFWRTGRFLIYTGMQLVSYKYGKIRLCKSWRSRKTPEIISVTPLAVVRGQETALLLRGRNLSTPGTKIHYTDMGGYKSREVSELAYQRSLYDEINFSSFQSRDEAPSVLGRCFIEVENGFKGNCFPIIIADPTICQELRSLESELDEEAAARNMHLEDQAVDLGRPRSREEVLHFLNELGWLFQRNRLKRRLDGADYMLTRFKFLFTFSVERDCCALVKTLLDMLVERNLTGGGLSRESLETLFEIHLLNRAVKRRCKNMVNLLIHYSISSGHDALEKYVFPPNYAGSGGITPLHLAASMSALDEIVDVLTSDPQEIGTQCWNSLLDANGLSPHAYASMRNNHSYNKLVAQKVANRRYGQVSVPIGNPQLKPRSETCGKCAILGARNLTGRRASGSTGLLNRPYIHFMLAIAAVCACVCVFFRALDCDVRLESIRHGSI